MADKVKCLVNGRQITLSKKAFELARKFYGAISEEELKAAKPVELMKPLIKPTARPVILKPPLKEVPEVKLPDVIIKDGDPAAEVKAAAPDVTGDPVVERPTVKKVPAKKAPVKSKKK